MALGNIDLNPQLIQAVRDAADIVAVASDYTRLTKAGRQYTGLCPIHKEKTPSFSVDPDKGLFYCFGCGAGGDAIRLHMLLSGDDFPAAIENLALRHGIPLPRRAERHRRRETGPDIEGALAAAAEFFQEQLRREAAPRAYLERRRIPTEWVERFGLGYAPDAWESLLGALHPRLPLADLEAAGLIGRRSSDNKPYDRFRHRLMFPIHSPSGRLVGFGGRTLGDDKAKYMNTAETERFHKSSLLYGLHVAKRAIRESGRALLVEGYFDVLGAVAAGIEGTVAGMGTALTRDQARLLARHAEEVVVGYDGDSAGETAARRALPLLLAAGLTVRRAHFGEGHDPDSLRLERGPEAVAAAVEEARDAVLLELERLLPPEVASEPRLQGRAAAAVIELLQPIPEPVTRFGYGRRAAERLGVPVDMIARRLSGERPRGSAPGPPGPPQPDDEAASGGASSSTGAPAPTSPGERRLLQILLARDAPVPPLRDLPPPEAFLDPRCRNIYRAFCTLYGEGDGGPPGARSVITAVAADPTLVDALAEIVIGGHDASREQELGDLLQRVWRRWQQQRLKELQRKIDEAQRRRDGERLEQLLMEKTALSRSLHSLP